MPLTELLALIYISHGMATFVWAPTLWLILTLLTPKSVLEKYFKEPHFSAAETMVFNQFPGSFIRTGIFGWMLIFPEKAAGRQIYNLPDYMPRWYAVSLRLFVIACTLSLFFIISALIVLLLWPQ